MKKDLYRSKEMAKFSHYKLGSLYYTVKIFGVDHMFPIKTVIELPSTIVGVHDGVIQNTTVYTQHFSSDLGDTAFDNEIQGSLLIRWIDKAVDTNELVKLGV